MKRNKSILHLCEIILVVLMLILILNLYLTKLLVDPDLSYKAMYQSLCMTLAFLVLCIVLALIQRELLARLLNNVYKKNSRNHSESQSQTKNSQVIPTVSSEFLAEKIRLFQSQNAGKLFSSENPCQHPVTGKLPIALISTDIENFHFINDKYGYPLGNEILNIVYEELTASSLSLFTARFFSDVFISIADVSRQTGDALREQIQSLDQKICSRIRDTYHISFFRTNSGIYLIPEEETKPETMISCANVARRIAKKLISHTCIYSDEIDRSKCRCG